MSDNKIIFDLQKEALNQLRESNQKFSYYIIALCVSCIGFAIYQTKDEIIDYPKIAILIAVLSWGVSIFLGLNFMKNQQYGLYLSYMIYENQRNNFKVSKDNPQKIKLVDDNFKDELSNTSKTSKKQYKYQLYTFFIGVLFYIIWHIFEMYINTIANKCHYVQF